MLKIAFHPIYKYELPEGHRFPMEKYELLPEQLLYEGTVREANFFQPTPLAEEVIQWTHHPSYWQRLRDQTLDPKEIRAIGFPMSPRLVERSRTIAQGTVMGTAFAQQYGIAMNIAGGTHHAYAFRGEGFCLLNDIAIAANYLLRTQNIQPILIIDLDVHQGNGSAHIFQHEPQVFTFSMHGAKNFPARKEISDLDIGLPDGADDQHYLNILRRVLPQLLERVQPQFIFYLAGVDVLATDKLGRLSLSLDGCRERDRLVFEHCQRAGVPVMVSMGGGYSTRLALIVEAHANTFREAQRLYF